MKDRAKTHDEFNQLINQALEEVSDLRASLELDEEFMEAGMPIIQQLESQLNEIKKKVNEEGYAYGSEDLPFMELLKTTDNRLLPLKHLLTAINNTHNLGLDADGG